jgi:hypothetical protein
MIESYIALALTPSGIFTAQLLRLEALGRF